MEIRPDENVPSHIQAQTKVVIELLESLQLDQPRIPEIGCGFLAAELAGFGRVMGIDLADEVIMRAQERLPEIEFRVGDFLEMDLPENHFEVAVSAEVLSHVEDKAQFLRRAASSTQPS